MSENINKNMSDDEKKRSEARVPTQKDKLMVYAGNVVKTTNENKISEETSLKLVLKISSYKDSLVTINSLQQKMIRDYKKQSSRVTDFYNELEESIRDLYQYLKYRYGIKSDEIVAFGYNVGATTIPETYSELIALAGNIVANIKTNNVTDEEALMLGEIIGNKKDELESSKAKKNRMLAEQKSTTIKVNENVEVLYETIRELIRYLDYKIGPKSEEFLKYGIKPLK